jgi:hypothetical protein
MSDLTELLGNPRRSTALVFAVLALGLTGTATAGVSVGVNDDAALDPTLAPWFYPAMGSEGLQLDTITLRWDEGSPTTVPGQASVTQAIAGAAANGVTVELDLFPLHSMVFTGGARCVPSSDPESCGDTAKIQQFAAWTAQVARTFPTVHQFVVMNECNQPLFVNPQWDQSGQNQSAEICGRALAAARDALKHVSAQNFVWGVGLSPRGNDNPNAASNSSTSPVKFLAALGTWFRAFVQKTGRTDPLMDGFDFHPYPIPQSQPFAQGYASVDDASVSNLARIYQAFYDGFSGTPQRTIGQQAGGGLPMSLNETGVQTDSTGRSGYVGTETSANAAGGVIGQYATEDYQASWYLQMLNLVACDPNVRLVNIFHLIDEPSLAGWQSGLFYADRSAKKAAGEVHDWIATAAGSCQGALRPWTPAGMPAAPPAAPVTPAPSKARIAVGVAGRVRIFDASTHALRRALAPFGSGYTGPISLALGDVNRDHVLDFAVAQGANGAAMVKLLNGKTGKTIASYAPLARSAGAGSTVALGDVNGDGKADLIVGTGAGSPAQVKVLNGTTQTLLESFSPFAASFKGGVSVAAGDVNGDGKADVIVGTGAGSPAQVRVFTKATGARTWSLVAFAPTFAGGTAVAAGDVNGDGRADLVVGAGAGGGSQTKVFDGRAHTLLASFLGAPGSNAISVAAG